MHGEYVRTDGMTDVCEVHCIKQTAKTTYNPHDCNPCALIFLLVGSAFNLRKDSPPHIATLFLAKSDFRGVRLMCWRRLTSHNLGTAAKILKKRKLEEKCQAHLLSKLQFAAESSCRKATRVPDSLWKRLLRTDFLNVAPPHYTTWGRCEDHLTFFV